MDPKGGVQNGAYGLMAAMLPQKILVLHGKTLMQRWPRIWLGQPPMLTRAGSRGHQGTLPSNNPSTSEILTNCLKGSDIDKMAFFQFLPWCGLEFLGKET